MSIEIHGKFLLGRLLLSRWHISWIVGQNVQKLQVSAISASYLASILQISKNSSRRKINYSRVIWNCGNGTNSTRSTLGSSNCRRFTCKCRIYQPVTTILTVIDVHRKPFTVLMQRMWGTFHWLSAYVPNIFLECQEWAQCLTFRAILQPLKIWKWPLT